MAEKNVFDWMARLGYAARGIVYVIIGGFAVLAAVGSGGQATDGKGALHAVLAAPFGKVLLGILMLGLVGFAAWRLLQGLWDADRLGREPKALLRRIAYAASAAIYVGLAYSALRLLLGRGAGRSGNRAAQDWTVTLLSEPFGPWLVGALGGAVAAAGLAMAIRGLRADFAKRLSCPGGVKSWMVPLGRLGFVARGAVFVLAGGFLILAALHSNASEARGLGGALKWLQQQPYGWIPLGTTAFGLFAFGLYQLALAAYRRIEAPSALRAASAFERESRAALGR